MPPPGVPGIIDVELQGGPLDGKRDSTYDYIGTLRYCVWQGGTSVEYVYEKTTRRTKAGRRIFTFQKKVTP